MQIALITERIAQLTTHFKPCVVTMDLGRVFLSSPAAAAAF